MAPQRLAESLQAMRPVLLRIARLQLRNEANAEDAVSETLLAALEKRETFERRSQLRTWVIAILKHKIIDGLRTQKQRGIFFETDDDRADLESLMFKEDGHFVEMPAQWGDPEQHLQQLQFFDVLELCVDRLPAMQGRIFMMREWFEFDTAEVCEHLGLTTSNVNVMLHRARLRLRDCLQSRWFGVSI